MKATTFLVLTILFQLQSVVLASHKSTQYLTDITTKPTMEYNPVEHLVLNQNGNKQVDGPIVKRETNEQIINPPRQVQTSRESNIEKIAPNIANNLKTDFIPDVKVGEKDTSSKESVRVKRQDFDYPNYYPIPIIIGGGGFRLGGYRGRGFGGRGFGGRGFRGRGNGGRGFGGRGVGGRGFGGRGFGGRGIGGRGIGGRGGFGGGRGGRG